MKLKLMLIAVVAFFGALVINAAPGDLDPTFSGDGRLIDGPGRGNGVAIQPDGKIVVTIGQGFMIARYDPDGSPDVTFGDNGRVVTTFSSGDAEGIAVAIQPDGKIVVAGYACPCDKYGTGFFALARYNPDGSLDLSFDDDGKVTTAFGDRATGSSIVIQPDQKIIVAGWSWVFGINKDYFALARYNPDGSLDLTFNDDGKITTGICSICSDEAFSVALQSDGKIVAVGGGFDGSFEGTKFIIVRYDSHGSLDTTFDSDGIEITAIGTGAYATAVTTQEDGKIVAAGGSWFDNLSPLVRYNLDGSLDTTFDSDGIVTMPIGTDGGEPSLAIQSDGKIVAAESNPNGVFWDFALARYISSGSLDATFGGGDGIATAGFDNPNDNVRGLALDAAGRAVLVGESNGQFAAARFLADSSITGTVTYGNAIGAPVSRNVSNVLMSGAGSVSVSAFSSFPDGTYSLRGFGSGAYTMTPSKKGGVNGSITSFDAGKIAQHAAGTNILTGNQLIVADVSGNGTISSFDAGQIARFASGIPGSGSTGTWIFTPSNRNYASITNNVTGEDFIALLMGDVSGNWINTVARPR